MSALVRRTANLLVVLIAAALVTVGGSKEALAHFGGGREPQNWRGEIVDISGPLPGVSFELTDSADRVEVRSTSQTPLIIYGYQHKEPGDRDQYVKISADGVWINTESQAGYLNETLLGSPDSVPEHLRDDLGNGEPVWEKVSDEGVYRWHDHRVHWMSLDPPPLVAADPHSEHLIVDGWYFHVKYGDDPEVTVTGNLYWVPHYATPWWMLVVAIGAAVVIAASVRKWRTPVTIAAGALAVAALGQAVVSPLPQDEYQGSFTFMLASAFVPALAIAGLCLLGIRAVRSEAFESSRYLLGASGALSAVQGSSDVTVLTRSQLEHTGPDALVRTIIAAAIGLGIGLFAAMVMKAVRRTDPEAEKERSDRAAVDIASEDEMREIQDSAAFLWSKRRGNEDSGGAG